jgi:hypothetical protein
VVVKIQTLLLVDRAAAAVAVPMARRFKTVPIQLRIQPTDMVMETPGGLVHKPAQEAVAGVLAVLVAEQQQVSVVLLQ